MTRLLLSCTAAVLLLAAPIGASAQVVNQMKPQGQNTGGKPMMEAPVATPMAHKAMPMAHKPMPMAHKSMPMSHKAMMEKKPMHMRHAVMHKEAGDASVEKLNEQSLMKAQGK